MSKSIETLTVVLSKVQQNYLNVTKGVAQARAQLADQPEDVMAAVKLLVDTFKHPEGVMAIVKSYGQINFLETTQVELAAMIAGLQIVVGELPPERLDAQVAANEEVLDSPLPSAGAGRQSASADPAAPHAPAAVSTEADHSGDEGSTISEDH